ncbi:extracellular solute-binding protein [Paenibacillus physcomitrellae]|uniref:ABC transporter substrate-binding protein n=1 Tax=Paenibacillus physcomitrellae TaxID=1619311 RepID=A0ABQ1GFM7_9BACL|nr:extracellular solute-binding protein [Paenibacillus physcomitrellae]GGA42917.1 ABC transporter substrate-binding protein [Paenibacillus physcomitrellae]
MKKRKYSIFSLAVVLTSLSLVIAGCGGGNNAASNNSSTNVSASGGDDSTGGKEPITLTISTDQMFSSGAPGIQKNPVADEIKKKTGVTMDIISSDPEKIKVMLAGGDLPDIMIVPPEQGRAAMDGNLAMPLNDLLEKDGQDILKYKSALDVINKRLDNTDGNYYFLPINVVPDAKQYVTYSPNVAWYTRWDLYKEEGYPELKSFDDMIPMIADELKKHPKTDEGKKVYGISGWTDWGLWSYHVPFIYEEGWTENTKNTVTKPDGSYVHRFAADGPLWRGVEFYNKAYRAGILDTDMFTQKMSDYEAKLKAGQLLSIHMGWEIDAANAYFRAKGQDDKGFEAQVVDGATNQAYGLQSIVGDNDPWIIITKSSKNPERAMEFLNYFRTYEGARLLLNGVQGVHWDVENGKPEIKDDIIQQMTTDANFAAKTGVGLYGKLTGIGGSAIDPSDGAYVDLRNSDKFIQTKLTPLDKEYSEHYGGKFPGDAWDNLVKEGKAKPLSSSFIPAMPALQPQGSDDLAKKESNIEQILIREIPKAIMTDSDEEFQKQKDRIMGLINKAGFEEVDAFWKSSYEQGLQTYNELTAGTNG